MQSIISKVNYLILLIIFTSFFAFAPTAVNAAEHGTRDEAIALTKQVVESLNTTGKDKTFAAVDDKSGAFVKGDLYVFIYDLNGTCLAHGANDKLIGKNLIGMKDADGKLLIQEIVDLAKTKGSGWVEYKFWNPVSKTIDAKQSYIERVGDVLVGVGVYKN